jgi:hypothetical protein
MWDPAHKKVFKVRDVRFDEGIGRLQQVHIDEDTSAPPVPPPLPIANNMSTLPTADITPSVIEEVLVQHSTCVPKVSNASQRMQAYLQEEEEARAAGNEWAIDSPKETSAGLTDSHADNDVDDNHDQLEAMHASAMTIPVDSIDAHVMASASKGGDAVVILKSWCEAMKTPEVWMPPMKKEF